MVKYSDHFVAKKCSHGLSVYKGERFRRTCREKILPSNPEPSGSLTIRFPFKIHKILCTNALRKLKINAEER